MRHTPPGTQIRAGTAAHDGVATLVVEDDGPGIGPELAHRVFDRFVRGAGDGGRGSGLGLAIVRAVAESHGGAVALEQPAGGHGTKIVITIPALVAVDASRPSRVSPGETSRNGELERQTSTTTGSTIGRRRRRS